MKFENRYKTYQKEFSASFDIVFRIISTKDKQICISFLSSLSDSLLLSSLVESIVITSDIDTFTFYPGAVDEVKTMEEAKIRLLSGQCVVFIENNPMYYCIETRHYPTRSTAEPKVEQSIRGSHDGFVENIILNVGLIRRRIRDPRLMVSLIQIGNETKTDVAYIYLENTVDIDVLNDFKSRISKVKNIEIFNEKYLCEALYGKTWNPYTHVRYSERPDICGVHLLQGYMAVLVDNSPVAMILPTTFFEQCKQMEEYTMTSLLSFVTRILRMTGILFSLYLLPLWALVMITKNPTYLNLPMMENLKLYEFGFQIIFADLCVEWIRMSLIHTPAMLSSIMGFIAVFVLGDMAIELGAYTKEILVMVALCNIGTLITPSYELSLANKFFRIFIVILTLCFKLKGFCIGILIHFIVLQSTTTIKYPYLYPLFPFSWKECKKMLFQNNVFK